MSDDKPIVKTHKQGGGPTGQTFITAFMGRTGSGRIIRHAGNQEMAIQLVGQNAMPILGVNTGRALAAALLEACGIAEQEEQMAAANKKDLEAN